MKAMDSSELVEVVSVSREKVSLRIRAETQSEALKIAEMWLNNQSKGMLSYSFSDREAQKDCEGANSFLYYDLEMAVIENIVNSQLISGESL